jgi:hypothetical protein
LAGIAALAVCGLLAALAVPAGATSSSPTFVQQITGHSSSVTSLALKPSSNITSGDRLIVLVGVWSSSNATASSVTDSAGNTYTEVLHFTASDGTEMSVWTAPITVGGRHRADHHRQAKLEGRRRGRGVGVFGPVERAGSRRGGSDGDCDRRHQRQWNRVLGRHARD